MDLLRKSADIGLRLLFPPRCPVCRDILVPEDGKIHAACHKKLKYVQEPVCLLCGKPILEAEDEYCSDCMARRHYFDGGRAVWIYEKHIRRSIIWFKYKHCREFADFYGESAVSADGYWIEHIHPDVIIPIPLNRKKLRTRGFNQAELLAKVIGRRMNIPVDTKALIRSHWTEPQKNLSPVQRFANLKKAFQVHLNPQKQYKTVLLIDDIYTTGSTMDACAKLLKEHGILKVYFVVLGIGSDAY